MSKHHHYLSLLCWGRSDACGCRRASRLLVHLSIDHISEDSGLILPTILHLCTAYRRLGCIERLDDTVMSFEQRPQICIASRWLVQSSAIADVLNVQISRDNPKTWSHQYC
ncbi:hypothetical protein OH76DRAFT_1411931 [Lentinus brumalis]|uniref:Uncharacterized protein n=1 Tax=Lentinus brumalis TaxID=2498619 RepID=A0A371CMX2_9APHY|nr:hypothetical protein OH76DRAFT_1411931 [Polyporus brumalis]